MEGGATLLCEIAELVSYLVRAVGKGEQAGHKEDVIEEGNAEGEAVGGDEGGR